MLLLNALLRARVRSLSQRVMASGAAVVKLFSLTRAVFHLTKSAEVFAEADCRAMKFFWKKAEKSCQKVLDKNCARA